MKQIVAGLIAFTALGVLGPSAAGASGWSVYSGGSSVSASAYFNRFSIHTNSWESERHYYRRGYFGSLLPRPEPVQIPANDCGPGAFQVLNANRHEAPCVGLSRR